MPQKTTTPTVTPWRIPAEFLELKNWFFPELSDPEAAVASKQRAIARTKAYMVRGNVPHAVECTGMLISAQIEDSPTANAISTRLAMSTALIRFVNGMIDPHQKGSYVMPMQMIAREIGLPVFLVDLRHTCTHETLPSLRELRAGVDEAVQWLYSQYWSVQNSETNETSQAADSEEIKEIFRQWRRLYRDNRDLKALADLSNPGNKIETRFAFLAKQLVRYYGSDPVTLFATMVHQKVLVSKNQITKSLLMPLLKSLPKELISDLFLYMFEEAERVDRHVAQSEELSLNANPLSEWLEVFIEEEMLTNAQKTMLTCSRSLGRTALNVLDVYLMHTNDAKIETIRQTMRDVVLSGEGRLDTAIETADMVRLAEEYKQRVKKEDRNRGAGGFVALGVEEDGGDGPFKRVRVN
ncbi:Pre-rRNA-processing protein [Yarrowia sp. B02]|nr:Pre-rRNA-processing protein [Yarrowia sp. B02]